MSKEEFKRTNEEVNLERMLGASVPWPSGDFESRLSKAVLDEVAARGRRKPSVLRFVKPIAAVAAAAAVVAGVFVYRTASMAAPVAGEVSRVYGIVTVANGGAPQTVAGKAVLHDGHRVFTEWGSRAEIVLPDKSTLRTMPHTSVEVAGTSEGARVALAEGGIDITASKQKAGKWLEISTPAARVKVLGTVLQVRSADFAGKKRTRVTVDFGKVQVSAAGTSVDIVPNEEAIIDEDEPPLKQAIMPEIAELTRLQGVTSTVVTPEKGRAGRPVIVDCDADRSASVWLPVTITGEGAEPLRKATLAFRRPFSGAEAYTEAGDVLPVKYIGGGVEIDLSMAPVEPGKSMTLIVRIRGVSGLFEDDQAPGVLRFGKKAGGAVTSLVEFRLPRSARDITVVPSPVERGYINERNILVVAMKRDGTDILDAE